MKPPVYNYGRLCAVYNETERQNGEGRKISEERFEHMLDLMTMCTFAEKGRFEESLKAIADGSAELEKYYRELRKMGKRYAGTLSRWIKSGQIRSYNEVLEHLGK